ncbi:hypothetical protein O0L34_g9937 [Tuta absoluta]|nr:hypothetical protein O0L34_g9937 [Tuta absoluta]
MKHAVVLLLTLACIYGDEVGRNEEIVCETSPESPDYFYYFAYGSNLLPSRMHINVPSAINCSTARLDGWRLDFQSLPKLQRWNGAVATIVKDESATVFGNLWRISNEESDNLDRQEGVPLNYYKREQVNFVMFRNNVTVSGWTYVMVDQPLKTPPEKIPLPRRPSRTYLQVILFGAIASYIPVSHIEYIQRFPHNGKIAPSVTRRRLGYPFYDDTFL